MNCSDNFLLASGISSSISVFDIEPGSPVEGVGWMMLGWKFFGCWMVIYQGEIHVKIADFCFRLWYFSYVWLTNDLFFCFMLKRRKYVRLEGDTRQSVYRDQGPDW